MKIYQWIYIYIHIYVMHMWKGRHACRLPFICVCGKESAGSQAKSGRSQLPGIYRCAVAIHHAVPASVKLASAGLGWVPRPEVSRLVWHTALQTEWNFDDWKVLGWARVKGEPSIQSAEWCLSMSKSFSDWPMPHSTVSPAVSPRSFEKTARQA